MTPEEIVALMFAGVGSFGMVVTISVVAFIVIRDALNGRTRG